MKNLKKFLSISLLLAISQLSIYPVKHLPRRLKLFRGYLNFITIFLTLILFNGVVNCFAQNIGINEPNPDNSAILEMTSPNRGLLIPRMTTAGRDTMDLGGSPNSVMIFNTTTECFEFYYNGSWYNIACTCTPPDIPVATTCSGATTSRFTANWNAATGANGYYLDVSENSSFSSFVTGYDNLDVGNVTSYDVTGLSQGTTYYYRVRAYNDCGTTGNSNTISCTTQTFTCGISTVTFDYSGSSVTYGTVVGQNSTCWLDRNLGALQQATAYDDYQAYGDLFQWGRFDHDHQDITWTNSTTGTPDNGTTSTNADNPANALFITEDSSPYDWRVNQDNTLWNGVSAANNPCPSGWRIPTETELDNERASWGSQDYNGAYASPLKLVVAGYRLYSDGTLFGAGSYGYYWSSSVDGVYARLLLFSSGGANMSSYGRAYGLSVRCIKD